jgi:DNA-binding SARP family transcriptional activator/Tfp pilus assembly protein PilF
MALLSLLALKHGKPLERGYLAGMLWDSKSLDKSRHSLSQLLYSLRKVLPEDCIVTTDRTVALSRDTVDVDLARFNAALAREEYDAAVEIYAGAFLESAPYLTDEFDDWRTSTAAMLEAEATAACTALIFRALEEEDHVTAAIIAKRALLINPLDRRIARVRVESLAGAGDVARALRELELYRKQFLIQLGEVPEELSEEFNRQLALLPLLSDERTAAGSIHLRLVGRGDEISQLREQWKRSREGCRIAIVQGEPGIGKTRLVQHMVRRAVLEGARAFMYSCSQVEMRLPYGAAVGLIRDGFKTGDVARLDPRWHPPLASVAPELLKSEGSSSPVHERVLWEAVAQYFLMVSESQPVVLAIDNFQWADESSREVLAYVVKRLGESSVFLLCAGRSQPRMPFFEDDEQRLLRIDLGKLGVDHVLELIQDFERAQGASIPGAMREVLVKRIGGHPFFLLEALRQLRGVGYSDTDSMVDLLTITGIDRYMHQRLEALPVETRSLVAAAAVLNRDVPLHLLARITQVSAIAASSAAALASAEGILAESHDIRFTHDLMREATYHAISPAQRVLWHSRIAETLAGADSMSSGEVAYHHEQALERTAAYRYAQNAAEQAMRLHSYSDAEDQYLRMLRCATQGQQDDANLALARFVAKSGRYHLLATRLVEVESSAARTQDTEALLVCELAKLSMHEERASVDLHDLIDRARRIVLVAERGVPSAIPTAVWQVAEHLKLSGDAGLIQHFTSILVERGREAATVDAAAGMLSAAALLGASYFGYAGWMKTASDAVHRAELSSDPVLYARTLFARGTLRLWSGELTLAADDYERALAEVNRFPPEGLARSIHTNYAVVQMERGLLDHAEAHAQAALREPRSGRHAYSFGNLALISLRRPDVEATEQYVHALLASHSSSPQSWIPVHAEAIVGLLDLVQGRMQSARRRAESVEAALGTVVDMNDSSHIHLLCARVACTPDEVTRAIQRLMVTGSELRHRDYIAGSRLLVEAAALQLRHQIGPSLFPVVKEIEQHCRANGAIPLANEASAVLSLHP